MICCTLSAVLTLPRVATEARSPSTDAIACAQHDSQLPWSMVDVRSCGCQQKLSGIGTVVRSTRRGSPPAPSTAAFDGGIVSDGGALTTLVVLMALGVVLVYTLVLPGQPEIAGAIKDDDLQALRALAAFPKAWGGRAI